jgi:hypothetical protein
MPAHRIPLANRFWAKVDRRGPDECWPWTGAGGRQKSGRSGHIRIEPERGSRNVAAPRVAWELTNGQIPKGLFVCHHCDNAKCVNPAHLFVGTASDNVRDMVQKGRGRVNRQHGEKNHAAKISAAQVMEIRGYVAKGAGTYRQIGARYGISPSAVHLIASGRNWPEARP